MTMTNGVPTAPPVTDPATTVTLSDGTTTTLAELEAGNLRQRDYTQKTQDLANQRKLAERGSNLLAALDQDPKAAMDLIARTYGVSAPAPAALAAAPAGQTDQWGDPIEPVADDPRIAEYQAKIEALQGTVSTVAQNQQRSALIQELERAEAKYGDIDREVVLRHMQANNLPSVEVAYRDLNWEPAHSALTASQQLEQEQADALAAKRGLSGVVASGGGVPLSQAAADTTDYSNMKFGDALDAALHETMQEMGVSSLMDPALSEG